MKKLCLMTIILATLLSGCRELKQSDNTYAEQPTALLTTSAENTSSVPITTTNDEQFFEASTPITSTNTTQNTSCLETTAETTASQIKQESVITTESEVKTDPIIPSTPSKYPEMEAKVLELINNYRKDAGLEPLEMDYTYYVCAEKRANECLQYWSHTRPDGRRSYTVYYDYGLIGKIRIMSENLAKNFSSIESIMEMLMDSPSHRRNILYEDYNRVTICIIEVEGYDGLYAMSQLFIQKD